MASHLYPHRYCIGALDKETGVMTLHRTQQFMLKPHIPGIGDWHRVINGIGVNLDWCIYVVVNNVAYL